MEAEPGVTPVVNYRVGIKSQAGFPILMGGSLTEEEAQRALKPGFFVFKVTIEQVSQ